MRTSKSRSLAPVAFRRALRQHRLVDALGEGRKDGELAGEGARSSASDTSAASAISARPTSMKPRSAEKRHEGIDDAVAQLGRSRLRAAPTAAPGGLLAFRSRCHGNTLSGFVWLNLGPDRGHSEVSRRWIAQPDSSRERFLAAATAFFIKAPRPFLAIRTLSAASVVPLGEVTFLRSSPAGRSDR